MKKSTISMMIISFSALIGLTFFLHHSSTPTEAQHDTTEVTEEANNIMADISTSKLQEQITEKLIQEGYTPTGTYGFSINNFEDKIITISLSEIPNEKTAAEKHIQEIVNELSQENQLGFFKVHIQY